MQSNAKTWLALMITLVGIQVTVTAAAEPSSTPGVPRELDHRIASSLESAQLLAQNDSPNLIDRLRAIRGTVTSEYAEAADETPTNEPSSAAVESSAPRVSSLPSVLIRRPRRSAAQPSTEVAEQTEVTGPAEVTGQAETAPANNRSETNEATVEARDQDRDDESSRRTSRRPRTHRATNSNPMSFHSASQYGGKQLALASQGPVMRIELAGPDTITVGKQAAYRVRLLNQGDAIARKVAVVIGIPNTVRIGAHEVRVGQVNQQDTTAGGQRLVWELAEVAARSQLDLAVALEPIKNQPVELQVDWKFLPPPVAGTITVLQPQLAVAIQGPSETRLGEKQVFKIQISNPGNGPAEGVKIDLRATGVAGQPNQLGTLPAGETRELEVELTAQQAGVMQILATATGAGQLKAETQHDVQVRRPELSVGIDAPPMLYAGSSATYEVRIANRGDAEAKDVILHFDLPKGVEDGVGIDSKPITSDQPKWRLGTLAAGVERVFTMKLNLTTGGKNHLTVRAQDSSKSSASETVTTSVESIADLKLTVNDPTGPVPVGKDITYEVTVVNRGSKEARDVTVVGQFSDGIEPTIASGQRSEIVPGQVIFDAISSLPAGGEITLKITAQAHKSGNLRFRAEMTCGDPETKLISEESTLFYSHANTDEPEENTATRPAAGPTPARR